MLFGLQAGGSVMLRGADIQGSELNLVSAKIEHQLDMGHAAFKADVNAEGLEVGRYLNLRSADVQGDELELASVKIGRQLDMSNATFMTSINAGGMQIGGNFLLGNSKFTKARGCQDARNRRRPRSSARAASRA